MAEQLDVGGDLQRARIARNLSLSQIADRTKISPALLRAIEENQFSRVPGGLFTRGYLRAYAREVQLDPESIVARYRAAFEPPEPPADPSADESPLTGYVDSMAADDGGPDVSQTAGLIVVLLIGAAYFAFARNGVPQSAPENGPTPTEAVDAAEPRPVATTGTPDPPRNRPLKLAIQTTGDCWVAATVDGVPVIARLMKEGERAEYDVKDELRMRIGDPAAFTFTLDGIAGRALGSVGTPVNVTLNRQNYTTVLLEKL